MKKFGKIVFLLIFALVVAFSLIPISYDESIAYADGKYVYLGGYPIGISVVGDGLIVLDKGEISTDTGSVFPLGNFSIGKGDIIVEINGEKAQSVYQLKKLVEQSSGNISLLVRHVDGKEEKISVTPAIDKLSKTKKIGLITKEDVGGIGTMTFTTENGRFACLGHHIIDGESGLGQELQKGSIYPTNVNGVVKGSKGKAGGLVAPLNRLSNQLGKIERNTDIGVYGIYFGMPTGDKVRVAERGEVKIGKAQIFTTISGTEPKLYDVDIVKVISQSHTGEKGLVLAVKDKELLELTGGIVQGMSGSPIIQNGLLVGAVTHVYLGDATRGYGVHSRFMYDYAYDTGNEIEDAA